MELNKDTQDAISALYDGAYKNGYKDALKEMQGLIDALTK